MKKNIMGLLVLSASMLLASCGGSSATSSSAAKSSAAESSSAEATTVAVSSVEEESSEEDDGLRDITIKVTITGDVMISDENALYMGTNLGSTTSDWQTYLFEKDTTVTEGQVWYKAFTDVEVGSYSYNFYVCDAAGTTMWNIKYINTEGDPGDNPRKLLVEEDGDINVSASFLAQPSSEGPALTVNINITNYVELGLTAWPQFIYTDSEGSTVWDKSGYTVDETGEVFTHVISGFSEGTYTCYVSLWNEASDGSWPEYSLFDASANGQFSFEFTASATLTITGDIALASENAIATFAYVND